MKVYPYDLGENEQLVRTVEFSIDDYVKLVSLLERRSVDIGSILEVEDNLHPKRKERLERELSSIEYFLERLTL